MTGASEEHGRATLWFATRPAVDLPLPGRWEEVPDTDWNSAWKADMRPVVVGRVTVIPPWLDPPAGSDLVVVIEPGMAFGTGHHETTTGCLAALQELDLHGRRLIDLGTGTGVLAIAAALLGAADVVAVDHDPEAVAVARRNVRSHDVAVDVREASAADVTEPADVVVANLVTDTLIELAGPLQRLLRPRGTLIASGASIERAGEVAAALAAAGLTARSRSGRQWAVLIAHRPPG